MTIRGIVQFAELCEQPAGSGRIEMILQAQGVGRDQPRRLIVPFEMLLADPSLEPESMVGKGFEAEITQDPGQRWVVGRLGLAARDLLDRPGDR